jgi:hypothetical protein
MDPKLEDAIRERAYFMWEREGCGECCDLVYWLRAEAELLKEQEKDQEKEGG